MATTGLHLADQNRWDEEFGRAGLALADSALIVSEDNDALGGWPGELDLLRALGEVHGRAVVEFGCGRGRLSSLLAKRGASVTGLDIGPNLVALAERVATANGVADRCTFRVADITGTDLPPTSADVVVGEAVLHHLDNRPLRASVAEAHRILRPGGIAVFLEPVENSATFEYLQNLIPIPNQRPSILQRRKWRAYLEALDDRSLTDLELLAARGPFRVVQFRHRGLTIRLNNFIRNRAVRQLLTDLDWWLTQPWSPLKRFAQSVIVTYHK